MMQADAFAAAAVPGHAAAPAASLERQQLLTDHASSSRSSSRAAAAPPWGGAAAPPNAAAPRGHPAADWAAHHRRLSTTALISAARILERVDEALLPAVYLYVGCALNATPTQLGTITFSRALVQALSSPLGGLAGHYFNRVHVIAASCYLWAACTAAFACVTSIHAAYLLWGINGLGLACMVPNGQSLIADWYPAHQRGKAFGWLLGVGNLGSMIAVLFATNLGGRTVAGMQGWRVAFLCIAAFSALCGAVMQAVAADPRCARRTELWAPRGQLPVDAHLGRPPALWVEVWRVLSTPTFLVIISQGIVGSMPGSAFAFATLYFELLGWSDAPTSAVLATLGASSAVGALLGGALGDWAAGISPNHGRIWVTQFSVASGLPLVLLWFQGMPLGPGVGSYLAHGALFTAWGLLTSWAATACNNPIFAEIVPAGMRSLIYAFDRSFEGAVAAMVAPVVGVLAERVFGFTPGGVADKADCSAPSGGGSPRHGADYSRARALAWALESMMFVPWVLCVVFYSFLHCTYKRDKQHGTTEALVAADGQTYAPVDAAEEEEEGVLELAPRSSAKDLCGPKMLTLA